MLQKKHLTPIRSGTRFNWLVPTLVLAAILALAPAVFAGHLPDPPDWESDFGEAGEFGDDDCAEAILLGEVLFYGVAYDSLWVNSNGNVTFDDCNTQYWALAENFAGSLMAASLLGDWDPSEGGAVWLNILEDGTLVVTWELVPEYFPGGDANTFQMAIYPNGTIRFSYQHLETDGLNWTAIEGVPEEMIVGVSSGTLVVAEGEAIPALEGTSVYLCWGGEEYFLASNLSCGAAPPGAAIPRFDYVVYVAGADGFPAAGSTLRLGWRDGHGTCNSLEDVVPLQFAVRDELGWRAYSVFTVFYEPLAGACAIGHYFDGNTLHEAEGDAVGREVFVTFPDLYISG